MILSSDGRLLSGKCLWIQGKPRVRRAAWLAILLLPALARAQEGSAPDPGPSEAQPAGLLDRDRLLGELGSARPWLEEHGLTFDLVFTAEGFWNARGGLTTHRAREYRGDVSLYLTFDTAAAGLWSGGQAFLHLQEEHGHGISERFVGDYQYVSNIDVGDFLQVSEVWYRQSLLEDLLWIKLGKQEANSDFALVDFGLEFLNSSAGLVPTVPLATLPNQDWGVVVGSTPREWLQLKAGAYQGRPKGSRSVGDTLDRLYGPMLIGEVALRYDVAGQPGWLRLGGWWSGDEFAALDRDDPDPGSFGESHGYYVTCDQWLWREDAQAEDEQGLGMFLQYGWAPEDRSEVAHYAGGGLQWVGALPTRDEDVFGVGYFRVWFSREAGFEEGHEDAIELFYRVQVLGWLSVKPDLQVVRHPGGSSGRDALVAGVRAEVVF